MKLERFATRHELFLGAGILMICGTLTKLTGLYQFSSDWFWFVAGLGLVIEGLIMMGKQKKFDKKYKVIQKE